MSLGGTLPCPHLPASLSPPPWFWQGLQRRATPHPSELKSMKKGMEVRRSEASAAAKRDSANSEVGGFCQRSGSLAKRCPLGPWFTGASTSAPAWSLGEESATEGSHQALGPLPRPALHFSGAVLNWEFGEESGGLYD